MIINLKQTDQKLYKCHLEILLFVRSNQKMILSYKQLIIRNKIKQTCHHKLQLFFFEQIDYSQKIIRNKKGNSNISLWECISFDTIYYVSIIIIIVAISKIAIVILFAYKQHLLFICVLFVCQELTDCLVPSILIFFWKWLINFIYLSEIFRFRLNSGILLHRFDHQILFQCVSSELILSILVSISIFICLLYIRFKVTKSVEN